MRLLRHEHTETRDVVGEAHRAVHPEPVDQLLQGGLDLDASEIAAVELELDALEEDTVVGVGVLLRVDDVAAVAEHEVGDRGDDTGLVGTREQQDRGGRHALSPNAS